MKRFPEKMVMAAIILSCGFVMHAEPSAQRLNTKRAHGVAGRSWQMNYAAGASVHSARPAKSSYFRRLDYASW